MCALKNNGDETSKPATILYPRPAPKRLLTSSNWITRNDSSSVNAILHPEINLETPRLKRDEKTKGNVIEKNILSKNNCYCRCKGKKVPKPTLFKRPNACVSYEGALKDDESVYRDDLKRISLAGCVCDREIDLNTPESLKSRLERLKKSKISSGQVGLKLSDQRKLYEEYRDAQREKDEDIMRRYRDEVNGEESEAVNTILDTRKYGTETSTMEGVQSRSEDGGLSSDEFPEFFEYSVPDFRREHYFETHHIGKLGEIEGQLSEDHDCVHQFKLDGRWLPTPLKQDPYGRSLCKICGDPMDGSSANLSTGYFSTEDNLSKSKLKNYAECYKNGLMPKTINLSRGKSKIELVLEDGDVAQLSSYLDKVKRPVYCNSLALRQQKMRMI